MEGFLVVESSVLFIQPSVPVRAASGSLHNFGTAAVFFSSGYLLSK